MKFSKLRKKFNTMDSYSIFVSSRLFGFSNGEEKEDPILIIKANDFKHALKRYCKRYKRIYKENHTLEYRGFYETTREWGKYLVINNNTKFKKFYY